MSAGTRITKATPLERAAILVERDLSLLTGPEIAKKYAKGNAATKAFRDTTGKDPSDPIWLAWNPFWHYVLMTWYADPYYRGILDEERHRDELADMYLKAATGQLDTYDGTHNQWPRRAFKSTFMAAFADWAPKRHKVVNRLDILLMYSHNSMAQAQARGETIKNLNRYDDYIAKHFPEFVIPRSEWGTKEEWDWPCRTEGSRAAEKSMTFLPALGKKAGRGYHYRLLDDWEDEDSRESEVIRADLAQRYQQQRKLKTIPFSREISCGTPYHIQSLYKPMLEGKHEDGTPRYYVVKTPALTDANVPNFASNPNLSVAELAKERANEIRMSGNDRFWYLQYQLDPTLTGEQAMQWEWFIKLSMKDWREKWSKVPHFKVNLTDPAWKGEEDQGKGCDTAIVEVAIFHRGEFYDYVLLEGLNSNELVSDEGAGEICRMMKRWQSPYYIIEQPADRPFIGLMRQVAKNQQPPMFPRNIDIAAHTKKSKASRISAVAGAARLGHWYILEGLEPRFEASLKLQVDEYPGSVKRDILDAMGNAHADEVLRKWIPISMTPGELSWEAREERHITHLTRYTNLPAIAN